MRQRQTVLMPPPDIVQAIARQTGEPGLGRLRRFGGRHKTPLVKFLHHLPELAVRRLGSVSHTVTVVVKSP